MAQKEKVDKKVKMWRLNQFIAKYGKFPICEKCSSLNVDGGHYIRGYNTYCKQAYGDSGYFCMNCCHVTFKSSIEEHKKSMDKHAPWCIPYEDKQTA